MKVEIAPAKSLKGIIEVPGDKSISHRGIIFGAIAQGKTRINNFLMSKDCISTIDIFRQMGINIYSEDNNQIIVEGKGLRGLKEPQGVLDAGNSGTTARLLMGLLSAQAFDSTLTGDKFLRNRPMDRIVHPLSQMGAQFAPEFKEGYLPITIKGRKEDLRPIEYTMPVASAQVKSSIILASLYSKGSSRILEPTLSRNHTEMMLKAFGGDLDIVDNTITTYPKPKLKAQDFFVPGDISSGAYFITAALLTPNSKILLKNLGINLTRAGILEVYKDMGANIKIMNERVQGGEPIADVLVNTSTLKGVLIGGDIIPRLIDELPIIALAATQAHGTTIIRNAEELRIKESDRIQTTVDILRAFGAQIEPQKDGMIIEGPTPLKAVNINPGTDHRMVMTAAIAALISRNTSLIEDAHWIDISYPNFFEEINRLRH